jgi:hypothetical protein
LALHFVHFVHFLYYLHVYIFIVNICWWICLHFWSYLSFPFFFIHILTYLQSWYHIAVHTIFMHLYTPDWYHFLGCSG